MLNKLQKLRQSHEEGFTLIELLVVIVIIGVLAAIALPIFLNQQKEAIIAGIKSDVRNTNSAIVTYLVKNPTATNLFLYKSAAENSGALATTTVGQIALSSTRNVIKIRSASINTGTAPNTGTPGSWDDYMIQGWNDELDLNVYRYIFDSRTGKYTEIRS